jgi:hypothetical protein
VSNRHPIPPGSGSRARKKSLSATTIGHGVVNHESAGEFNLMDYLRRSTQASGVPLYVEDLEVIHKAAKLVVGILKDQNIHSMTTRPGSKKNV